MPIEDTFEMLMKIFHRNGTELVEDTSDFHPVIGVGVASILSGHEQTVSLLTVRTQFRRVGMKISQDKPNVCGTFSQQLRRRLTIGDSGGGQDGGSRETESRDPPHEPGGSTH